MQPPQRADFEWYFIHAREMALGQGYHWRGQATAYWPIGWPFILSIIYRLTGPLMISGLIFNTLLSIGMVILIYKFIEHFTHHARLATIGALFYTLLPSQIEWNAVNGSEESFTFLLVVVLFALTLLSNKKEHRWWPFALVGLLLGLDIDIRPIPLLFPIFYLFSERWLGQIAWRIAFQRTVSFVLGMVVGIFPVTLRNWLAMHHFVLVSTNGGVNLWQGIMTNSGYYWSYNPNINPLLAAGKNEVLENAIGEKVAFQYYWTHPWQTFLNGWAKIYHLYNNDVNAVRYTFINAGAQPWLVTTMRNVDTIAYWIFMLFVLLGLMYLATQAEKRPLLRQWAVILCFLVYYTLVFFFFPAWDRFRYPLMPLYALFTPMGCAAFPWIWHRTIRHRFKGEQKS
ncbi:glycosyltransferase family 39 protein [Alicyclobacillus tolerans]|uniref:glycosyltransferase family 39 protein n=1 Tax=Alicyclobacillus tolerans TaxID=90970 RepID=UPI003B7B28F3